MSGSRVRATRASRSRARRPTARSRAARSNQNHTVPHVAWRRPWNAKVHAHPDALATMNGRLSAPNTSALHAMSRTAPRRSPRTHRYTAKGGTSTAGKSLIAAPRPSAAPARASRPRVNANTPTNSAAIAKTSQFWNAYRSTGVPIAHRQARPPHRRSSATVIATLAAAAPAAVTRSTPSAVGAARLAR